MSPYAWLAIAAVMAVIEVASLSLITIWFVVGGLVAFVIGLAGASIVAQAVVFLAVSLVCLALFRPLVARKGFEDDPLEGIPIGQTARVVEEISPSSTGRIETLDHMTWAALSSTGEAIPVGESVRIIAQDSIVLIVERN